MRQSGYKGGCYKRTVCGMGREGAELTSRGRCRSIRHQHEELQARRGNYLLIPWDKPLAGAGRMLDLVDLQSLSMIGSIKGAVIFGGGVKACSSQHAISLLLLCVLCLKSPVKGYQKGHKWLTNWQWAYGISGGEYGLISTVGKALELRV